MAELVSREIYAIRESKMAITRGTADNMPKDGVSDSQDNTQSYQIDDSEITGNSNEATAEKTPNDTNCSNDNHIEL